MVLPFADGRTEDGPPGAGFATRKRMEILEIIPYLKC
jgi:hypothetical protein